MKGARHNSIHRLYTLGPPVVEQLALESAAAERIVACYFPTRAAQRCLSILTNHRDSPVGEFFWIAGAPGSGKTHFLNYFLALLRQLCDEPGSIGRELVLALDYAEQVGAINVENEILAALAGTLGGDRRSPPLWRTMGTSAALEVALHETGRAGVRAITIVIDLGSNESPRFFSDLVPIAKSSKRPKLTVIAAGAGIPPPDRIMLEVEAADAEERVAAAVARARQLDPRGATTGLYSQIKIDPFVQQEIFPFHPAALRALERLAQPAGKVGSIARLTRAALASAQQEDKERLIYPCDLFDVPEIRRIIEQRIAGEGRAALKSARSACLGTGPASRTLAEQIVHTLALDFLCGQAPALLIDELCSRLPAASRQGSAALGSSGDDEPTSILRQLAARSKGVIQVSAVGAAFVPVKNSSPDVEAFNRALPLINLFDPAIDSAQEIPEFNAKLAQLRQSLSGSIQEAHTVLMTLREFAASGGRQLEPEREAVISGFLELAGSSARKLIEIGADQEVVQAARATALAYEELAVAAASVPRLIAMRQYLEDTRLDIETIEPQVTGHLRDLATERRLLEAELGAQAPFSRARDSREARFEKFKWNYIEQYRAAHEERRSEMEKAAAIAGEIDRHLQALARLNSIAALGARAGAELQAQAQRVKSEVTPCQLAGQFSAQAAARCPECGYVLGTPAPTPALALLLEKINRALYEKLGRLSRGAIALLIKKYDRANRLEGFLKITQAAQTQALVAALDDELTSYLARLLNESAEPGGRAKS